MPWMDIVSPTDWASIWYITNSRTGQVSSFDPDKPTILMIHPYFFDSSWMRAQFNDSRIRDHYNIIAHDSRCCGKTKSTPTGKNDTWLNAADIAFLHHRLRLPPVHVFASEPIASHTALRFASLWPEKVLSLTLCQVPPPRQLEWVHASTDEFIRRWSYADELSVLETALQMPMDAIIGTDQVEEELIDDIYHHYVTTYPPFRRSRTIEYSNLVMNRGPIEPKVAAAIACPTLIIHGQHNASDPVEYANTLSEELHNVPGGATVYVVKGGRGTISLIPSCASIVNKVLTSFLTNIPHRPHTESSTPRSTEPTVQRMRRALYTLAEFMDDPSIAARDPSSPASFSCVSPKLENQQMESIYSFAIDQREAFNPLRTDGHPQRKWSRRHDDHWAVVDHNGMSTVDSSLLPLPVDERREGTRESKRSKGKERTFDDGDPPLGLTAGGGSSNNNSSAAAAAAAARHRAASVRASPAMERPSRPGSPRLDVPAQAIAPYGPQSTKPVSESALQVARARRAAPTADDVGPPTSAVVSAVVPGAAVAPNAPDRNAAVRGAVRTAAKNTAKAAVKMIL